MLDTQIISNGRKTETAHQKLLNYTSRIINKQILTLIDKGLTN